MTPVKVVHLVDDMTAGGVTRNLRYLLRHPGIADHALQSVSQVRRGFWAIGQVDADVIVSHLTINWRGLPGLVALRAMNPSVRLVHVEHSYTRAFAALNVARKSRFFALLRVAYSLFDVIVSVSHAQAEWMKERGLVDPNALHVIHPEVELGPLTKVQAPMEVPRAVGAIGRLERQKGFDILIEAFQKCTDPDARLLIFGEGSERSHLETLAAGDPRIEFRGHVSDPTQAYGAVDIVAVPSRWEAFGLVVREAKAAGRPVLLAPVDGLLDQVQDSDEVVAYCDAGHWAKALNRILGGGKSNMWKENLPKESFDGEFVEKWCEVFSGRPDPVVRFQT